MAKQLPKATAKGYKGEQFVRSWATELECVNFIPEVNAPSIDGMIQLYDVRSDANFYLFFQAKCGNSYVRNVKPDSKYILLTLNREDIANWQRAKYPVIIVWVSDDPPAKRYALWTHASRARRGSGQIRISKTSLLDSAAFPQLLELARTYAGFPSLPKLITRPLFPTKVSTVKAAAREFYWAWRNEGCVCPVFGKVEITLKAWRHMTRASAPQPSVCHKLSLLPFAREILANATKARFLRLLKEDIKTVTEKHEVQDADHALTYSFPSEEKSRLELHAVCGIYCSSYRSNLIVEVVVEVLKVNNNVVRTTLYGVHEKTK